MPVDFVIETVNNSHLLLDDESFREIAGLSFRSCDSEASSLPKRMFFISLSLARLRGDFPLQLNWWASAWADNNDRTTSLCRPLTAKCRGEFSALSRLLGSALEPGYYVSKKYY